MAQIVQVNAIILWNIVRQVAEQRNLEWTKTAFFARRLDPGEMREMRVNTAGHHFGVDFLKLVNAIGKGQDFGGTNEGTIWE